MRKFAAQALGLLLCMTAHDAALGAPPEIHASISADTILIGDRFSLEVIIHKDMMQTVSLPSLGEGGTTGYGVEVLAESGLDTLKQDGRRQTLRKRYELTSFDAGVYEMGHYPVLYADKNIVDTLYSPESLPIVVNTLAVATQNSDIYDIKEPLDTPLLVSEFAGYLLTAFVVAVAAAALVMLVRREISKRRRKDKKGETPQPAIPPHVRAIQDLETLHNQKLWQSGKTKTYYTGLSDILRSYLSGRYSLNAMEMTSDEILRAAASLKMSRKSEGDLRSIMLTADLVKFAKYVPDAETNETLYYAAYYFIEDTKHIATETVVEEAKGGNDEE